MQASDVMVREVVTIGPQATVRDLASLLINQRISGVPVVDADGKLVGIVSEADLLHRTEAGTDHRPSRFSWLFDSRENMAADFVRSHSRKVSDVMTREVVTAAPSTNLRDIAILMEKNGIKRIPIVDNGKVVGIVSRANLIQALTRAQPRPTSVDDATLRNQVMQQISTKAWARPYLVNALVHDGTVELWGVVASPSEKEALRVAAEITPGVRAVTNNLVVRNISTWT